MSLKEIDSVTMDKVDQLLEKLCADEIEMDESYDGDYYSLELDERYWSRVESKMEDLLGDIDDDVYFLCLEYAKDCLKEAGREQAQEEAEWNDFVWSHGPGRV